MAVQSDGRNCIGETLEKQENDEWCLLQSIIFELEICICLLHYKFMYRQDKSHSYLRSILLYLFSRTFLLSW